MNWTLDFFVRKIYIFHQVFYNQYHIYTHTHTKQCWNLMTFTGHLNHHLVVTLGAPRTHGLSVTSSLSYGAIYTEKQCLRTSLDFLLGLIHSEKSCLFNGVFETHVSSMSLFRIITGRNPTLHPFSICLIYFYFLYYFHAIFI